jgi:hypothetical protein
MSHKTAVEQLMIDSFGENFRMTVNDYQLNAFQNALEIEEAQIKDAVIYGLDEDGHTGDWKLSVAQKYYNEKHLGIKDL